MSLKQLIYQLVFTITLLNSTISSWSTNEDTVTRSLQNLTNEIIIKTINNYNCIVWLKERDARWPINLVSQDIVVAVISLDTSPLLNSILEQTFKLHCNGYVIQTSEPGFFINLWEIQRKTSIDRHNPRMIILPWNITSPSSNHLFSLPPTEQISDLLLIEFDGMNSKGNNIVFKIITNNFYTPFDSPDRSPAVMLGTWPFDTNIDYFPDKIRNLKGKKLRIATLEYPPYSIVKPFDGMELRLLTTFCELHNCTIIKVTDEYLWGEIWKNKSGNGVIGNVFMDKADIGTGAIYLWYNEYKHLDFTYPYLQSKVTVLVPKPRQLPEWRIPINAFSSVIWISLLISITFIIVTLYFVNKYTNNITAYQSKKMVLEEFSTLPGVILRAVGMVLLQSPPVRLRTGSPLQRFFTLSEILFLLFTTIYSGALSSILTIPAYYPPIDHPKDLYKAGIPWASTHNAWIYSLLGANEPYLNGLINRFEVHDTETLKKLAKKGGYGFCIEIMAGGHVTHQDHLSGEMIYGLHVMKNELYFTPSVTVLRKGSSYTAELSRLIHYCLDAGLMMLWEGTAAVKYLSSRLQTALEQSQSSSHEFKKRPVKLKLKHVEGAFIALGLGLGIATIIFIAEKLSSLLNKKI